MNDEKGMTITTAPLTFTDEQRRMIRDTYANGANDEAFAMLMEIAKARRLNPLLKQVHFVERWDSNKGRKVWSTQVSIDGLRAIAERTGIYAGQDEPEFTEGPNGIPTVCKVRVYRKDWGTRPAVGVAYFAEYVQTTKDGKPTSFWQRMPHTMLAKCAESLALRKAFPEDTSGLYTPEEMGQADNDEPQREAASVTVHDLAAIGIERNIGTAKTLPAPAVSFVEEIGDADCVTLRDVRNVYAMHARPGSDTRAMVDDVRAWLAERGVPGVTGAEATAILSTLPEAALRALSELWCDEEHPVSDRCVTAARAIHRAEWDEHSRRTAHAVVVRCYAHATGHTALNAAGAALVAERDADATPAQPEAPADDVPADVLAKIAAKGSVREILNSVGAHAAEVLTSPALAKAYAARLVTFATADDPRSDEQRMADATAKVIAKARTKAADTQG